MSALVCTSKSSKLDQTSVVCCSASASAETAELQHRVSTLSDKVQLVHMLLGNLVPVSITDLEADKVQPSFFWLHPLRSQPS